jgi:predicted Zn-dependent protease
MLVCTHSLSYFLTLAAYLSFNSQSLIPSSVAMCLTVLPNLIDLLVKVSISLNTAVMNVEVNGDVLMQQATAKDVEEILAPQFHAQVKIHSQKHSIGRNIIWQ